MPWFFLERETPPIEIRESGSFNDPWQDGLRVGALNICAAQCGLVRIMSEHEGLEAKSNGRTLPLLEGRKVIARSADSPIKVSFNSTLYGEVIYQAEETTSSS